MTHSRPPAAAPDLTPERPEPVTDTVDDFVESEFASTSDSILRTRHRAHAAAMIAITYAITAEFPTATTVLIDRSTRSAIPASPTLLQIRDGNTRQLSLMTSWKHAWRDIVCSSRVSITLSPRASGTPTFRAWAGLRPTSSGIAPRPVRNSRPGRGSS